MSQAVTRLPDGVRFVAAAVHECDRFALVPTQSPGIFADRPSGSTGRLHYRAIYEVEWSPERQRWLVWRGQRDQVGGEASERDEAINLALEFAELVLTPTDSASP
jgi:hypothetical protein